MRRSQYDDEWAERVWERFERRRDLPRRRMAAAWDHLLEEIYGLTANLADMAVALRNLLAQTRNLR